MRLVYLVLPILEVVGVAQGHLRVLALQAVQVVLAL
jgi:hypothetical protein